MSRSLLALALLVLAAYTLSFAFADLLTVGPRDRLATWARNNPESVAAQAGRDLQSLELAHGLRPWDADLAADLGRMSEWITRDGTPWSMESSPWRRQAIGYYQTALRLRPGWAFAWAHLAQARLLIGFPLEEILAPLDKAMVLGPAEPGVQRKVLWVGFSLWARLNEDLRARLATVLFQTLEHQAPSAIGMAVHFNREALIRDALQREADRAMLERLLAARERH
ncbi:MAG: hypothetical protein KDH88_16150 [Chromatiales bacterium]|nr:hypothetical protein [Chromatiales bacterium]